MNEYIAKKRTFIVLFFLFFVITGCSKSCREWRFSEIKASCPFSVYSKGYLPACNTSNAIEVELIQCDSDIHIYLNIYGILSLQPTSDFGQIDLIFEVSEETYFFVGDLLEGDQKILLSNEAKEAMIAFLMNGEQVVVSVGRYREIVLPDNFLNVYNRITVSHK